MPVYCYRCPECDEKDERYMPLAEFGKTILCKCGVVMHTSIVDQRPTVRGEYNKPIVSDSMAFDPIDIEEHRKKYPDIDLVVDEVSARPVLRSLSQRRAYQKERGFVDTRDYR